MDTHRMYRAAGAATPLARLSRNLLCVAVVAAAATCTEPQPPNLLSGATVLFCPEPGTEGHKTLGAAVVAVDAGGTILVCDGLHDIDNELVNKPVTIRSQNKGGATIGDVDPTMIAQQGRPAIRVHGIESGVVRFVDLKFNIRGRGVLLATQRMPPSTGDSVGTFDKVQFDSTEWIGRNTVSAIGIYVRSSTVSTAHVDLTNSKMSNMYIGIFTPGGVEVFTQKSTFSGNTIAGVDYSFDNGTGPTGGGSSHGRIEDNILTQCGSGGCIRLPTGGAVHIARNHMQAAPGALSQGGIVLIRSGSALASDPVTIENNTIIGATLPGGSGPSGWTFQSGIQLIDPGNQEHRVTGNTINETFTGIAGNAHVHAHDNFISNGYYAFQQSPTMAMTFQRNDVTGVFIAFLIANGPGDYRCNWWGQTSGPPNPPSGTASRYTPFSTVPIAGKAVACP